jgi:hypothetical protein
MVHMLNHALRRCCIAAAALALLGLAACGDLAAALPPRPSPFPTLSRLPSVTPVTPSPTPPPTSTIVAERPVATPGLPLAFVPADANMRSGPGTSFDIVAVVSAGSSITLSRRQDEWYEVRTADGVEGWMSNLVLDVDPAVADSVPLAQP